MTTLQRVDGVDYLHSGELQELEALQYEMKLIVAILESDHITAHEVDILCNRLLHVRQKIEKLNQRWSRFL